MASFDPSVDSSNSDTLRESNHKKRRKIGDHAAADQNSAAASPWRSEEEQRIYSRRLVEALRRTASSAAKPRAAGQVRETADRVLAATARGRTRWSRAILSRWRKLRTQHKKAKKKEASSINCLKRTRIGNGERRNRLPAVQKVNSNFILFNRFFFNLFCLFQVRKVQMDSKLYFIQLIVLILIHLSNGSDEPYRLNNFGMYEVAASHVDYYMNIKTSKDLQGMISKDTDEDKPEKWGYDPYLFNHLWNPRLLTCKVQFDENDNLYLYLFKNETSTLHGPIRINSKNIELGMKFNLTKEVKDKYFINYDMSHLKFGRMLKKYARCLMMFLAYKIYYEANLNLWPIGETSDIPLDSMPPLHINLELDSKTASLFPTIEKNDYFILNIINFVDMISWYNEKTVIPFNFSNPITYNIYNTVRLTFDERGWIKDKDEFGFCKIPCNDFKCNDIKCGMEDQGIPVNWIAESHTITNYTIV